MKSSLLSPHQAMLMKISSHVKNIQPKVILQSKSMIMHDEQTFFSYLTAFLHLVAFVCLIALTNELDSLKQRIQVCDAVNILVTFAGSYFLHWVQPDLGSR